jgi:hypothetical protein
MLSGAVYTVVGIKNKLLHIYLSAAYLSSLSIVVLILYVMNLPVSDAVQGAYVVAAAMTGLILGGGALVFPELTEGLACLLGGFCVSMWLLVLKPGGLLTSTTTKAIFIAAFTVAGFSTSFSHYTRPYGLIGGISFGGATVLVLGIDCYSLAGLKEFWAYLWALNDNLFPLGATTYPMTRGIKVEIAAIIVISIVGILSQMKLWKIIRDRRDKRTTERLEDERSLEREEENVGKRIENLNARERNQWENVYGDKDRAPGPNVTSQRDSGVGDMDSQKKGPTSTVASVARSGEDDIEMSDIPTQIPWKPAGLVMSDRSQENGPITIRIDRDLGPEPNSENSEPSMEGTAEKRQSHMSLASQPDEARADGLSSKRLSNRSSNPPLSVRVSMAPDVVPLPFKVPEGVEDDDTSSVATFADEEREGQKPRYLKHMSAGSALIRRLSDRSMMSGSPRSSKRFSMNDGPSTEDLVVPHEINEDGGSSVAATLDGLSDEDERSIRSSMGHTPGIYETTASEVGISAKEDKLKEANLSKQSAVEVDMSDPNIDSSKLQPQSPRGDNSDAFALSDTKRPRTARSVASAATSSKSRPPSFTAAQLPPQLSKVVMSYRTNEWAKHLSNAEVPDLEELKIEEPVENEQAEAAAPVDVEDLQQSASSAAKPAPLMRSSTSGSKASVSPYAALADSSPGLPGLQNAPIYSSSTQSQPTNAKGRLSTGPSLPRSIAESPIEDSFSAPTTPAFYQAPAANIPYGSSNTLMGRRESMVRNKSLFSSTPDLPRNLPPQAHQNFPPQAHGNFKSMPGTRVGSDAGSIYNGRNSMSNPALNELDTDNISLSQRRDMIRQSSLHGAPSPLSHHAPPNFDSHQPQRQTSVPTMAAREQQLASWRASVQQDLGSTHVPQTNIERQRSLLWQERQAEEQRRAMDAMMKGQKDSAFDERMRRGDMLVAHRDALRKMQAAANKNA